MPRIRRVLRLNKLPTPSTLCECSTNRKSESPSAHGFAVRTVSRTFDSALSSRSDHREQVGRRGVDRPMLVIADHLPNRLNVTLPTAGQSICLAFVYMCLSGRISTARIISIFTVLVYGINYGRICNCRPKLSL